MLSNEFIVLVYYWKLFNFEKFLRDGYFFLRKLSKPGQILAHICVFNEGLQAKHPHTSLSVASWRLTEDIEGLHPKLSFAWAHQIRILSFMNSLFEVNC